LSEGRHRCGGALGCRHSFLKGIRCTPFSAPLRVPRETLGLVWAAASSSSHPFLKVLAWYAELQSTKTVVEFSEGRSDRGSSSFSSTRRCGHSFLFFVSFLFLCLSFFPFGLVCAAAPASSLYRVVAILI
jgi:hypothetical protein